MQTGYSIDSHNYIHGPQYDGQFYINHDNYIYGPNSSGVYFVDSSGSICGASGPTGFIIRNGLIYGPSPTLPWF